MTLSAKLIPANGFVGGSFAVGSTAVFGFSWLDTESVCRDVEVDDGSTPDFALSVCVSLLVFFTFACISSASPELTPTLSSLQLESVSVADSVEVLRSVTFTLDFPPPKGTGGLVESGGYAGSPPDFGTGVVALAPPKGAGGFIDIGGYDDAPLGFGADVLALLPPPKGTGGFEERGG